MDIVAQIIKWRPSLINSLLLVGLAIGLVIFFTTQTVACPGCEVYSCNHYYVGGITGWRLVTYGYGDIYWCIYGHIKCRHPVFWYTICEETDHDCSTAGYCDLAVDCSAGDLAYCTSNCRCVIYVK